jgi:Coenzyme PQQ synthesis protein D (PqqD)
MELPTPNSSVIYRSLSDGAVLFSLRDEVYFGLNAVGAEVWEMLPPCHATLDELCAALSVRHPDVTLGELRADVVELLAELQSFGLVIPASEFGQDAPAHATVAARVA